jgi:hypothetical protein
VAAYGNASVLLESPKVLDYSLLRAGRRHSEQRMVARSFQNCFHAECAAFTIFHIGCLAPGAVETRQNGRLDFDTYQTQLKPRGRRQLIAGVPL